MSDNIFKKPGWYQTLIWKINHNRVMRFIMGCLPEKRTARTVRKAGVMNGLWVIIDGNGKLNVFDKDGAKVYLKIKKGAWKLKPSINMSRLNEFTATMYVNIADSEEEMRFRIELEKDPNNKWNWFS
jgi:hypothetical protein